MQSSSIKEAAMADPDEEEGFALLHRPLLHVNAEPISSREEEGEKEEEEEEETCLDCWGRSVSSSSSSSTVPLGGWTVAFLFLGSTSLQGLAIYGCTINLVIFLVEILHQDNASAANAITNWLGTAFISSLIGGCLGDAYLGRLWTTILYQILYIVGLILFAISSSNLITQQRLETSCVDMHNCEQATVEATPNQISLFYISLYLMGLGFASITPNILSLGADQFKAPSQKSSFITLYMASTNVGMLIAISLISYVQNEGQWVMGFWISAIAGILGFLLFLAAIPRTRQFIPGKNPLFTIANVILAAAQNSKVTEPFSSEGLMEIDTSVASGHLCMKRTNSFRWLDKAAKGSRGWTKRLCTMEEVEEVKSLCRLMPFWVCGILVSAALAQKGTLFVLQGATMDNRVFGNRLRIPPSSMGLFSLLTVVVGAPLYSWVIVPWIQRSLRNKPKEEVSSVERMGAGLLTAISVLFIAALVESLRLRIAHEQSWFSMGTEDYDDNKVPVSIFWLVPQYVLEGCTTVLFGCGHLDFNYTFSPQSMRSLATAISLSGFAIGNYFSSFIVQGIVSYTSWIPNDLNRGHLDYFYLLLDVMLLFTFVLFLVFSKWHYKQVSEDVALLVVGDSD